MTHEEVQWIKYQMALNKITQSDIATIAGCSFPMVSQVIHGRKRSAQQFQIQESSGASPAMVSKKSVQSSCKYRLISYLSAQKNA
ncbi:MAG: hypothetical protein LBC51_11305, partial [Treponema sp.]|nr:hypothetical protein [Treponema sp.]